MADESNDEPKESRSADPMNVFVGLEAARGPKILDAGLNIQSPIPEFLGNLGNLVASAKEHTRELREHTRLLKEISAKLNKLK